jgi:hypothetical protein
LSPKIGSNTDWDEEELQKEIKKVILSNAFKSRGTGGGPSA